MTTDLLRLVNDHPQIGYTTEASLRDGLAALAHLAGWEVETEHHIVGWGRPDLYLRGPDQTEIAVEIKLDLRRAATIRKAFQQADVYAKALVPGVDVILTAPTVDHALAQKYDLAYPDVWFLDTDGFVRWLYGASRGMSARHLRAYERQQELARGLDLSVGVLRRLALHRGSSVGFVPDAPRDATVDIGMVMDTFFSSALRR